MGLSLARNPYYADGIVPHSEPLIFARSANGSHPHSEMITQTSAYGPLSSAPRADKPLVASLFQCPSTDGSHPLLWVQSLSLHWWVSPSLENYYKLTLLIGLTLPQSPVKFVALLMGPTLMMSLTPTRSWKFVTPLCCDLSLIKQ